MIFERKVNPMNLSMNERMVSMNENNLMTISFRAILHYFNYNLRQFYENTSIDLFVLRVVSLKQRIAFIVNVFYVNSFGKRLHNLNVFLFCR